jgi:hypothetical protein
MGEFSTGKKCLACQEEEAKQMIAMIKVEVIVWVKIKLSIIHVWKFPSNFP